MAEKRWRVSCNIPALPYVRINLMKTPWRGEEGEGEGRWERRRWWSTLFTWGKSSALPFESFWSRKV
jgi:hypothetical protein